MHTPPASNNKIWTIIGLVRWAASYFKGHAIDSPRSTAEILLAHALDCKRIDLYLNYDQPLAADELQRFKVLIQRRINREPVAYIVGTREFWSLELEITPDVLIPRPETECLVEAALKVLTKDTGGPGKRILELGTGSGAITLALACEQPRHVYFASDRFARVAMLARKNAVRHHADGRIYFFVGDWMDCLNPAVCALDMVVSNPPYIPSAVLGELQPEISRYEPSGALDAGDDGLECLRGIIETAGNYLKPDGVLLLEIGHDQKDAVQQMASRCGPYEESRFLRDYSGHDRVVELKIKAKKGCGG
jgi:release factor glutamine methyltransferase